MHATRISQREQTVDPWVQRLCLEMYFWCLVIMMIDVKSENSKHLSLICRVSRYFLWDFSILFLLTWAQVVLFLQLRGFFR